MCPEDADRMANCQSDPNLFANRILQIITVSDPASVITTVIQLLTAYMRFAFSVSSLFLVNKQSKDSGCYYLLLILLNMDTLIFLIFFFHSKSNQLLILCWVFWAFHTFVDPF